MSGSETCGHPTRRDGTPCELPASEDDGFCWLHSDLTDDRARGGRRTKLTPEVQAAVCEALAEGHSANVAAAEAGITSRTHREWRKRGRAALNAEADGVEQGPFGEYYRRTEQARRRGEREVIEAARDAALESKNAQVLLRMAQLQYPESWGDDQTGAVGGRGSSGSLNVYLSSDRELETDDYRLVPAAATDAGGALPDGRDTVSSDFDGRNMSGEDESG